MNKIYDTLINNYKKKLLISAFLFILNFFLIPISLIFINFYVCLFFIFTFIIIFIFTFYFLNKIVKLNANQLDNFK